MLIETVAPFHGQHCETTTTGTLLKHINIDLSEAMLFGIGQGLGFIYWDMKSMPFPFIGGRIKPDLLTRNIVNNLGLAIVLKETASAKTAWENVKGRIDEGIPVGLKLDCYYLDYFSQKFHFAAHYVAMYGYDDDFAYLIDTTQQGSTVKTALKNLSIARSAKGPMSSPNLSYTISQKDSLPDLAAVIKKAIKNNALEFLNPPIKNFGYKGIEKTSSEIKKWFTRSHHIEADFTLTAALMERGGTGGAIFRNIYRDFLKETLTIIDDTTIQKAYSLFQSICPLWTEVAGLIHKAGKTEEGSYLKEASDILLELSKKEYAAMELLTKLD